MLRSRVHLRRKLMTTSDIDDYKELLIRIDERLILLVDRMSKVEQAMLQHQNISLDNRNKIEKLNFDVYGDKNNQGLLQKVEQHDKLLTKVMTYFTVFLVAVEFVFKYLLK